MGIQVCSERLPTQISSGAYSLSHHDRETQAGTGIKPCEGSAAVLHHCTRLYGPDGPILSTSITNTDSEGQVFPFVFEVCFDSLPSPNIMKKRDELAAFGQVGDASVVKGLNEAILSMREGCKGVLTLPPHMAYNSQVRLLPALNPNCCHHPFQHSELPYPSSKAGSNCVSTAHTASSTLTCAFPAFLSPPFLYIPVCPPPTACRTCSGHLRGQRTAVQGDARADEPCGRCHGPPSSSVAEPAELRFVLLFAVRTAASAWSSSMSTTFAPRAWPAGCSE